LRIEWACWLGRAGIRKKPAVWAFQSYLTTTTRMSRSNNVDGAGVETMKQVGYVDLRKRDPAPFDLPWKGA